MSDTVTPVKKTTRARKTAVFSEEASIAKPATLTKTLKIYEQAFSDLLNAIRTSQEEFATLQKNIGEMRESWNKEQKDHITAIQEGNQQEEIARKREKETYNYEIGLARKKSEDEFAEKKSKWEKELQERKDEIAKEKQELEMLRKQVGGFETEKEKAVREASAALQKQLESEFAVERKLREQEVKSEKELLAFKITNLAQENSRQANEVAALKTSLEEATRQLKDVAVKVIESSGSKAQTPVSQES